MTETPGWTGRVKEGWTGRVFEDFEVGDVYYHPLGKTITEADNQWFTLLTQNTAKVHFDDHFASTTEFRRPLVNSTFLLALVTGQSVIDLSFNVMANLGWEQVTLPAPVFHADTIYSRSTVLAVRGSRSRLHGGIVRAATEGYNQDGVVVIRFIRSFMVYRRGCIPDGGAPRPPEDSLAPVSWSATDLGVRED